MKRLKLQYVPLISSLCSSLFSEVECQSIAFSVDTRGGFSTVRTMDKKVVVGKNCVRVLGSTITGICSKAENGGPNVISCLKNWLLFVLATDSDSTSILSSRISWRPVSSLCTCYVFKTTITTPHAFYYRSFRMIP
jgi:hypothetical protein